MKISCPFRARTKYPYSAGRIASCRIKLGFQPAENNNAINEFCMETPKKTSRSKHIATYWNGKQQLKK